MTEVNDQQVLAKIRTLLTLERNYLSEERIAMSEFRKGLTLTVIGLSQVQLLHIFFGFCIGSVNPFGVFNFVFFSILKVWNLDTVFFTRQAKDNQQNENNQKNRITKISKIF